jgi:serine/threonine-protein kinase RsbW
MKHTRILSYDILFNDPASKYTRPGVPVSITIMSPTGIGSKASLVIGNTIAEMEKVVDFVDRFGAVHAIPQAVTNDLNLCLDELLNNTISYGYEDQGPHSIAIDLSLANGLLIAKIQDDAIPVDPLKAVFAAPDEGLQSRKVGGLGVHFVRTLMDELDYTRVGQHNVVTITKKIRGEGVHGDR